MACMCGDPGCPSCGMAQGAPECMYDPYVRYCGDPTCECAEPFWHADGRFEVEAYQSALAEQDAAIADAVEAEDDWQAATDAAEAMYERMERAGVI